jgi:hypothetical protein
MKLFKVRLRSLFTNGNDFLITKLFYFDLWTVLLKPNRFLTNIDTYWTYCRFYFWIIVTGIYMFKFSFWPGTYNKCFFAVFWNFSAINTCLFYLFYNDCLWFWWNFVPVFSYILSLMLFFFNFSKCTVDLLGLVCITFCRCVCDGVLGNFGDVLCTLLEFLLYVYVTGRNTVELMGFCIFCSFNRRQKEISFVKKI